jgi:trehalose 6-phosphate synthase/phosphatase
VASKSNGRGVLILSEMAGSAKELLEAISVNPNNIAEVSFSNSLLLKKAHLFNTLFSS